MDAALHAELGRAELDRLLDPRGEVLLGDLVGIGRALALAEPAEGAADDADVGEVDVAVDDEGDGVAGQLGPQLVGGDPHLLDHLRPRLGEERRQLVLAQRLALAPAWRSRARPGPASIRSSPRRPDPRRGMKLQYFELDHVEDALLHPLGVHVLGVDAEPLGQRVAPRRQLLADLMRAGERLLGRDVVAVRREPAEVGRPRLDQLRPPVGEVRRDLDPDVGHQPLALLDQPLDLLDPDRRAPAGPAVLADAGSPPGASPSVAPAGIPVAPTARPAAASAMSATSAPVVPRVRHEVLEDHLLQVAVAGVDVGQRFQRLRPAPPRSPRSRPGSRR